MSDCRGPATHGSQPCSRSPSASCSTFSATPPSGGSRTSRQRGTRRYYPRRRRRPPARLDECTRCPRRRSASGRGWPFTEEVRRSAPPLRVLLRPILIAVLASSLLLCAAGTASANEQLLGAQSHALWGDSSLQDMQREFRLLDRAGASVVRVDLTWSTLETEGKGSYSKWYVDKFEAFLREAEARHIKVIATLWATPCWASSAPDSLKQGCGGAWWNRGVDRYPPRDPRDYADAAAWVAQRWGSRLAALEVWNEPNLPDQSFLKAPDPAAAYAQILNTAYPRIKQAAPGLTVLGGALAFSDEDFLNRLYAQGIKGNFDGLSFHPYNEWRSPDDPWKQEWRKYTFITGVPAMHDALVRHGDGAKQLWLTEFGFSSCADGDRWCVTERDQASYIRESLRIVRGWPFVRAAVVYNLRNKGTTHGREDQFGLVRRDFTPKPAYAAFKAGLKVTKQPAKGRIVILSRRNLRLRRRGLVLVRVQCVGTGGDQPCSGRLKMVRYERGRLWFRAVSERFHLGVGKRRHVRIRLSRQSRRAVARRRRLSVTALAATASADSPGKRLRLVWVR